MKEKMLSFGKGEDAVEVAITVSSYKVGERLYVGLSSMGDVGLEPFSNLTINLPYNPAGINEGYIERNDCKNLMEFIERHKLGRILPEKGYSGRAEYAKAVFDLDRLAEYDPAGVEEYRCLHGIKGKEQAEEKDRADKVHQTEGKDWTSKRKRGLER